MNMIKEMLIDWPGRFLLLSMILGFAIIPLLIWATVEESKQWAAFSVAHECKVVGSMSGSTSTGVGFTPNGQVTTVITTTPGKTAYACNDGMTYWR